MLLVFSSVCADAEPASNAAVQTAAHANTRIFTKVPPLIHGHLITSKKSSQLLFAIYCADPSRSSLRFAILAYDPVRRRLPCFEKARQQRVAGWRKRIGYGNAAPDKSVFQVLRKHETAIGFGRSSKDDRVPDSDLMVGGEIDRRDHHRLRCFRDLKGVAPTHDGESRLSRRTPGLSHQQSEQFAENLYR